MVSSSAWLTDGSGSRKSDTLALDVYLTQQKYAKVKHCNITFGLGRPRCNCYTVLKLQLFLRRILPEGPACCEPSSKALFPKERLGAPLFARAMVL
jgi:hypothetical protein